MMEHRTFLRSSEEELAKFMELMSLSAQMVLAKLENSEPLLQAWAWFDRECQRRHADAWDRKKEIQVGNPSGHDPLGGKDTTFGPFSSRNFEEKRNGLRTETS